MVDAFLVSRAQRTDGDGYSPKRLTLSSRDQGNPSCTLRDRLRCISAEVRCYERYRASGCTALLSV